MPILFQFLGLSSFFIICIIIPYIGTGNTTEKVMLEDEEKEEKLQTALESQHEHFSKLMVAVRSALDHKLQHQQLVLVDFIRWIEHRMNWVGELGNIDDLNELFKKLHPHFDFLDCKLIVDMSEMFLNNEYFGDDKSLVNELKEHMVSAKRLRSLSTVKQLKNDLKKIYFPYQTNLVNMPHIQIELHNPWYEANIEALYLLIGHLLPHKSKHSILKYIEIETGSVRIKYFVHESKVDCLIAYGQGKLQFMRLIGIFGLTINGEPILEEDENMNFSFELALLEATKAGHDEAVQFLLELGDNIDYYNEEGRTALMLASIGGHEQVVQTLISAGVNVNIQDNNGYTALMLACDTNSYTIVNYLLQTGANPNIQNDDDDSAIIIACHNNHSDIVRLLLQYNADPLITNRNDDTALTVATSQNSIGIVEMLLEHLAESQKTSAVTSALTTACQYGHSQIIISLLVKLLDIIRPDEFQLFVLCAEGDHNTTKSHIYDTNVNINCTLVNDVTPLMIASSCGHTETVQVLLQAGANVHSTDNDGYSPLVYAITGYKSLQVIEQLLKAGAQSNVFINDHSIVDKVREEGREDICKLLQQFSVMKIKKSEEEVLEQLLKICDIFTILNEAILSSLQKLITERTVLIVDVVEFLHHYLEDTELKVDNIDQLFNVLQPHYYFLNVDLLRKIIDKFIGGKLENRLQDYISMVKGFEETTQLQLFVQAIKHIPLLQPPVTTTRTCTMIIKFHEQWQQKNVAHVHKFLNYSFSKENHFLNHIIIEEEGSSCVCKFVVPKCQLDSLIVIAIDQREFMYQVGVYEVYIGDQPILIEDYNHNFSFSHVFQNTIEAEDYILASFLTEIDVSHNVNNSIHKAARDGNIDAVEVLLKKDVDINIQDENGETALMLASQNGHHQIVELLLKEHADINQQNENEWTALMIASQNGHHQVVELLLKEHADINTQEKDGWTALMLASQNGHHQVVELLLKELADINTRNKNGVTALMLASENDNHQVVEVLLKEHTNFNQQDENGWTALMIASQNGHHQVVELLLKEHADINTQKEGDGWTALMLASQNGHHQVVELLLKEHSDINTQNINGWTALMVASHNGHHQVVELLLKEHANINRQDENGWTALMIASHNGHHQVVELLLKEHADINTQEEGDGWTALMLASQNGHHQVVELLLKEHANINQQDENGWTALMIASHNGHHQVVELLLKEHADINTWNKNGVTALMLASENDNHQVIELLLKEHANINQQDESGWTSLMLASQNGHFQVVELLLKEHADINTLNKNGMTALMLASENDNHQVIELLLKEHANINQQDESGWTSLMLASQNGHFQVVELLLKEHADINTLNKNGVTALMLASENDNHQVVEVLLKEHANINQQDENGWTALMIASHNGHHQVVELLLKEHVDINTQEEGDGWTALMLASQNGHHQVVELLLKEHANINQQNENGWTALMIASHNGHHQVVELLLKEHADINTWNKNGVTALMLASENDNHQVAEVLLKEHANINQQDESGWTALMLASQNGHFQVVELLLKEHADINTLNKNGVTALMLASENDNHQVAEVLLKEHANINQQDENGWTALMIASQNGHHQVVELLLKEHAGINTQEEDGWTALMLASQNGHHQVVELLLKEHADINHKRKDGVTALMIASLNGHTQTVKLLLQWDVDVTIQTKDEGYNALMLACQEGHLEVVECLLQSQVDPNILAYNRATAFSLAALSGNRDLVNVLLDKVQPGTDEIEKAVVESCLGGHPTLITFFSNKLPHLTNDQRELLDSCVKGDLNAVIMKTLDSPDTPLILGLTPLMVASSCGHVDIVDALIQAGANVKKQESYWGLTPLFFAVSGSKSSSIVETFLKNGANPNVIADNSTPLDLANGVEQVNIIDLLTKYGGQTRAQLEEIKEKELNSTSHEQSTIPLLLQTTDELMTYENSRYTIKREMKQKRLSIISSFTSYNLNSTHTFRNTSMKQDNKNKRKEDNKNKQKQDNKNKRKHDNKNKRKHDKKKEVKEIYTVSIN